VFRKAGWLFVLLFGVALAGATLMNLALINQARTALNEGILRPLPSRTPPLSHLALVIPETRDSFFDGLTEGVKKAAAAGGAAVQVFRYHESSPDQAEAWFQLCLSARLDGVLLYSVGNELTDGRRRDAAAANVVFVPVGTQVPAPDPRGFIGSSRLLQGIEAGNQATQKLGSAARIGLILSSEADGSAESDPVYRGVEVALRSYPGARIVRAAKARPGLLSGEEAAQALLRAEPGVNLLIGASAPITEGAAQVIVDQGRVGRVLLVGTDESPTIDRLVDKGVILASIVRDSRRMGAEAVGAYLSARAGKPLPAAVEVGFTVRRAQEAAP